MSNNNDDKNVAMNFLAGLGVGALVGAVAALLLAPKSGSDTRDDIRSTADELKDKTEKMMQDLSESSEDLVRKSREVLESTKVKVQQAIDASKHVVARKHDMEREEAEPTGE